MKSTKWWKSRNSMVAFSVGGVLAITGLVVWAIFFYPYVTTQDARVAADVINITPMQQRGRIITIHAKEGERVKKGDLLIEMDHELAEAALLRAEAKLTYASKELYRYTKGVSMHWAVEHDLDLMKREDAVARAEFRIAKTNLEDTYLRSPADGVIIRNLAEVGNILEPGQTAMVVAGIDDAWISANIEETSIALIEPGQPVFIHVDEGYDLKGIVKEVIQSTAAQFALIPSDNASGNFTKVVQRIPIKVAIEEKGVNFLRVGQSVELKVKVH